jgi:hypothetical protein
MQKLDCLYVKKTTTYGFTTWTVYSRDDVGELVSNTFMSPELASIFFTRNVGRLPLIVE